MRKKSFGKKPSLTSIRVKFGVCNKIKSETKTKPNNLPKLNWSILNELQDREKRSYAKKLSLNCV